MPESDSIADQAAAASQKDVTGDISALRSRLAALEARVSKLPQEAAQLALSMIVIQRGQNVQVSGGNGKWTISCTPPVRTFTGSAQCVDGQLVITIQG